MNDNKINDKDFVMNLDDLLNTINSLLNEDSVDEEEVKAEDKKVEDKKKEEVVEDNSKIEDLINQLYEKEHIIDTLDNLLEEAYNKIDKLTAEKVNKYTAPITEYIREIRFNGPATIIFWTDNTKTITICKDEHYDIEKGVVVAILKKLIGNNYNEILNSLPVPDKDEMYDTNKQIILDLLNTKKLTDAQKEAVKYFMP